MINPLNDYVLLRRMDAETKIGSIFVPATAQEKPQRAEVIAVGPGKLFGNGRRAEPLVKKGDIVVIARWAGSEVTIDGKEHIFIREEELLAIE